MHLFITHNNKSAI